MQGGAQPAETLQRLRDLNCPVVMGNADAWLITGEETSPNEHVSERQKMIRDWSLNQLSHEEIAFIQRFQPTIEVSLEDGKKMLCFHGSPRSFDDVILPDTADDTVRQFLRFCGALYPRESAPKSQIPLFTQCPKGTSLLGTA